MTAPWRPWSWPTASNFPDAVAGSPALHSQALPLLLTTPDSLNSDAAGAIDSLGAEQVVILGGTAAISQDVQDGLEADGLNVVRLAGATRYETAVEVANWELTNLGFSAATTHLATGQKFPDALAGGPLASVNNGPIVLTMETSLPAATEGFLTDNAADIDQLIVFGGTAAIDDATVAAAQAAADAGTNQSFSVTPSDAATLTAVANPEGTATTTDDRQFSVTNPVAGATHTIALFPAANVTVATDGTVTFKDADSNNVADGIGAVEAWISVVNGAAVAANTQVTTVMPSGGTITFTVDGDLAESVVPVVFADADSDGQLDLTLLPRRMRTRRSLPRTSVLVV